jgi:hypothetical protein
MTGLLADQQEVTKKFSDFFQKDQTNFALWGSLNKLSN